MWMSAEHVGRWGVVEEAFLDNGAWDPLPTDIFEAGSIGRSFRKLRKSASERATTLLQPSTHRATCMPSLLGST
jgi:hypothetical protein